MDFQVRTVALGTIFAGAIGCSAARLTAPAEPARTAPASPTPIMDFLATKRPRVTDEQLAKLRELPLESCWATLQGLGYRRSFEGGFTVTQPGKKVSGRAVTMRYLPVR